jgi:uncharacterized protein
MDKRDVIKKIKNFIKALKLKNIRIEKVFLFGSYAFGKENENSDIDVAVISPDFGKSYLQETRLLMEIGNNIDLMIFPAPYSLEEYNMAKEGSFLFQEIIKKGIPIEG